MKIIEEGDEQTRIAIVAMLELGNENNLCNEDFIEQVVPLVNDVALIPEEEIYFSQN